MKKKNLLWALLVLPLSACFDSCQPPCDPKVEYPEPGACSDYTKEAGTPGGPCAKNSFGDYILCNDHSECYSGTCIPCGGDGEVCCMYGEAACFNGTCSPSSGGEGYKKCNDACGHVGEACCPENYCGPDTGGCDPSTNTCAPVQYPGCENNPLKAEWGIPIRDAYGCGDMVVFHADTYEEAVACVEPALNAKGLTVLPLPQTLGQYKECNSGGVNEPNPLTIPAYSQEDAHNCAQWQCGFACTTTDGPC